MPNEADSTSKPLLSSAMNTSCRKTNQPSENITQLQQLEKIPPDTSNYIAVKTQVYPLRKFTIVLKTSFNGNLLTSYVQVKRIEMVTISFERTTVLLQYTVCMLLPTM